MTTEEDIVRAFLQAKEANGWNWSFFGLSESRHWS